MSNNPIDKAKDNPNSLRMAINAMCYECIYDGSGGSGKWRQQVEDCTAPNCPLYNLRPRTMK